MSRSEASPGHVGAGGELTIDLGAIAANWRLLSGRLRPGAQCGAVVKADAYGLGLEPVARALSAAGCRTFFVALPDEGLAVRAALADAATPAGEAEIFVFNGPDSRSSAAAMAEARLTPVLNHLGQARTWSKAAANSPLPALLHVDTGMTRLGFDETETTKIADDPTCLSGIRVEGVMSHLACADQPSHKLNQEQRRRFDAVLAQLAPLRPPRRSLANSSGIFLGTDYHYDLVRPGAALFGVAPQRNAPNPMAQVVSLKGKILQTHLIDTPRSVGYGATHRAKRGRRIATVAVGYADGYFRALSGSARAHVGQTPVQVVGRVSMDLITVDVTDVPENDARPGDYVDLIGLHHTVDDLAREAGTIGYEVLTALGPRYARRYIGAAA
ncbi:MAG: alanine racemase [Alphaproteobacteria bacterium]